MAASPPADERPTKVLFVCLGNICRSPTAHGVFQAMVDEAGFTDRIQVSSAGTGGWHVGDPPHDDAVRHADRRGYDLSRLRARQVKPSDLADADLVLAMDRSNLENLRRMAAPADQAKVQLFLDFAPEQPLREVPDPYGGGAAGFERVLDLVEEAARGLLKHLQAMRR